MFVAVVTMARHIIDQVAQNHPGCCPQLPRIAQFAHPVCGSRRHGTAHDCTGCPGGLPPFVQVAEDCPVAQNVSGSCDRGTAYDSSGCPELPMGVPTDAQVAKGCPGACPQSPRIARLLGMFPAVVTMALHMISQVA